MSIHKEKEGGFHNLVTTQRSVCSGFYLRVYAMHSMAGFLSPRFPIYWVTLSRSQFTITVSNWTIY